MDNEKPIDAKEALTRLFQLMGCFGFKNPRTEDENFTLFKQFFECFGGQKPKATEQTEDAQDKQPQPGRRGNCRERVADNDTKLQIRISPEVAAILSQSATLRRIPLSNYCALLLTEWTLQHKDEETAISAMVTRTLGETDNEDENDGQDED